MENPSTVTLTADNTQADIIEKVSINILITDKSFHSFAPAQVQQREYRTELIDKGKNISFSSVVERVQDNITYGSSGGNVRFDENNNLVDGSYVLTYRGGVPKG